MKTNFGLPGSSARYCFEHKSAEMVHVVTAPCLADDCDMRSSSVFNGYCRRCFVRRYPEKELTRGYLLRQRTIEGKISEWYKEKAFNFPLTFDTRIGASRRRPDVLINCGTHAVIIEIDERQHSEYNRDDEEARLFEIWDALKKIPARVLRFNPDGYNDADSALRRGCFKNIRRRGFPRGRRGSPWRAHGSSSSKG
jgi:very-short-patch-repair endonuclease